MAAWRTPGGCCFRCLGRPGCLGQRVRPLQTCRRYPSGGARCPRVALPRAPRPRPRPGLPLTSPFALSRVRAPLRQGAQRPALAVKVENLPAGPAPVGPRQGGHRVRGAGRRRDHPVHRRLPVPGRCPDRAGPVGPLRGRRNPAAARPRAVRLLRGHPARHRRHRLPAVRSSRTSAPTGPAAPTRRDRTRLEPHNLATSTAALYSAGGDFRLPPRRPATAVLRLRSGRSGGTPASAVTPLVLQPGRDHMDVGGQVAALVQVATPTRARRSRATTCRSPLPTLWSSG